MTGVRCPLGTVVDLSPSGLKAQTTVKPSVLIGHTLSIHVEAGDRKFDIMGKVVWIKRAARFKKEWRLGVQFEDQSDAVRDAISSIANAFRIKSPDESADTQATQTATVSVDVDDLYVLLGLTQSASTDDIREAYRKLAFQWHPDRCSQPGAVEVFDRINKAHAILRDPASRRRYDDMAASGQLVA